MLVLVCAVVCYISHWAGSRCCLPFSVGEDEAHQAQLTITHIRSALEGEQWRRWRASGKEREGGFESEGCKTRREKEMKESVEVCIYLFECLVY